MSINANSNATFYGVRDGSNGADENTPLLINGSPQSGTRGSSFASSVFNLMNAIMGSGILGLAYAMANTGIVGFSILLVVVSIMAAYSVHLLLKLCDQTGLNSYEDLGGKALRKPGKIIVGVTIIVQNVGGMASYLFILKSELPAAIAIFVSSEDKGSAWYEDGRLLLIIVTICVLLPLSMLPKIGFLSYTSSIAFFFMLYFTVVVVVKKWSIPCPLPLNDTLLSNALQISNSSDTDCTPKLFIFNSKSSYAIPTMAFSFLCHTAILPIYCELDRPSKAKMQNVTNVSIGLSFLLYFISALFGYLTFYRAVKSELLLGYEVIMSHDIMVIICRFAILISVLLTVPIILFPARKAMFILLFGTRPVSWLSHTVLTLILLGVVLLLAIFVPDISTVFGIVGSTTSSSLLFVFPGIFYLKMSGRFFRSFDSIGAIILLVFGIVMGITSFIVIVMSCVKGS